MNQDILIALLKEKNIYSQLVKDFPGLYSACLCIKQNINRDTVDKSITKIIKFYNANDKFKTFIDDLIARTQDDSTDTITNNTGNNVSGMVIVLDKKEETYKKLMQTAAKEKWQYKGIAIVDQFDNIRLYFY